MTADFTEWIDLASERLGGIVLRVSDEFFAPRENLLKAAAPVFIPDKYVDTGKWMDGWETRRHRAPDHDWCVIRLGAPGVIRGIVADTAHFTGNFPEACSLEAGDGENWVEVLPRSELRGDSKNQFAIDHPYRYTHVRFHIYPDGGVARLRVFGEPVPEVLAPFVDLAAAHNGGRVVEASDMYFGSRHNLIFPGRASGMHDGWETRRRRGEGHDWALIQLACEGEIGRAEVDTLHYKGNFPESCAIETDDGATIVPRTKLTAHSKHIFEIAEPVTASRIRLRIYPDGGVSRLRVFGSPTQNGREQHRLKLIHSLPLDQARRTLARCCGSHAWVDHMLAARPFASHHALLSTGADTWRGLAKPDWLEAFAAHPRIGEKTDDRRAAAEQSGAQSAAPGTLDELHALNREYQAKFGFIYIVCAAGKSAEQMLDQARRRIINDPPSELSIAAEEQLAITLLRIAKIGAEPL